MLKKVMISLVTSHTFLYAFQIYASLFGLSDLVGVKKKRTVVVVSYSVLTALFSSQIALYLTSQSMVLSKPIIPFFYFGLIVDIILVYSLPILRSITDCKSIPAALVKSSESSIMRL